MAVGDLTRDTGSPTLVGTHWLLTGTAEVNTTATAFALMSTKSRIISFHAVCEDDAGSLDVQINANASGTATNGTVTLKSNLAQTNTFRYECRFIM